MPDWIYDPNLRGSGYRNATTGRILSYAQVQGMISNELAGGYDVSQSLSNMVAGGVITPKSWRDAFRQEIKDQYISQYLLGHGGRATMTSADWGSVGGMIADQYRYLENFYRQVQTGDLTEAQLAARMNMYINSAREAYERALGRAAPSRGYKSKYWVENPAAENCDDCDTLQAQPPIPIDEDFVSPSTGDIAIPGSGATICLTNCQCHIEYSSDEVGVQPEYPENSAVTLAHNFGLEGFDEVIDQQWNDFQRLGRDDYRAEYLYNKDKAGDWALSSIVESKGKTDTPTVLTKQQFDDMVAANPGGHEVWRGIDRVGNKSGAALAGSFRSGNYFPGYGIYGNGTYTAENKDIALRYGDYKEENVLRIFIPESYKLMPDAYDLEIQLDEFISKARRFVASSDIWPTGEEKEQINTFVYTFFGEMGKYAALQGYDGIYVPGREYYVLFNRTDLYVEEFQE